MRFYLAAIIVSLCMATTVLGGDMNDDQLQRYAYFYFMDGNPEEIGAVAALHARYWQELRLDGYRGGPFSDFSGGLILFMAKSEDRARKVVSGDPFVEKGLIGKSWLKGWTGH